VVAHGRDRADYERFARLTSGHRALSAKELGELEPVLDGRFTEGLFYPDEGRVEPRRDLPRLHDRLRQAGVTIREGAREPAQCEGIVIDCRGLSARDTPEGHELRGVKGETVTIETHEISLSRAVRLLHPRHPIYVIPRSQGRYLIGATQIESEDTGVSVRSVLELLSAAYSVHPAFAEARVVEVGAGLRPAYPDNLPRIDVRGGHISVNGLYRHGFLLAPALAELTVAYVERGDVDPEVMRCS
jgi:glycine oxidase